MSRRRMELRRFKVTNFRSVSDSGWIDVDDVTTLVGVNEAGKSNLLLALWKLKPAKDGKIDLLSDAPRELYSSIRGAKPLPVFISAEFALEEALVEELQELTGATPDALRTASVTRDLGGGYTVGFTAPLEKTQVFAADLVAILQNVVNRLTGMDLSARERGVRDASTGQLRAAIAYLDGKQTVELGDLVQVRRLTTPSTTFAKRSAVAAALSLVPQQLDSLSALLEQPDPSQSGEARNLVLKRLPSFVYYSNYGNLDSEIYLPHVIENLKRDDLTGSTAAKARTLRVLFDFVGLDAQEILEKGREPELPRDPYGRIQGEAPAAEIDRAREAKKERDVLLQSASTKLTANFREWWKQGNYIFDFAADGNHFRIWVSDAQRPERIELENRSTGLQWFLSFYLVFLVERSEKHEESILLLDEAGLSLHPLVS